jgi:putative ubiquitin-RnfH superfamily antitoxin RatB of RatAB toxin-antitoxin module
MAPELTIEVVYALPEQQTVVSLSVPDGTTVARALELSGVLERLPAGFRAYGVGIYGRVVSSETRLTHGDRIEIYRPLVMDPKQARRRRAERIRKS